jgi:hypothetical protein
MAAFVLRVKRGQRMTTGAVQLRCCSATALMQQASRARMASPVLVCRRISLRLLVEAPGEGLMPKGKLTPEGEARGERRAAARTVS